jgi:hypothetical protein
MGRETNQRRYAEEENPQKKYLGKTQIVIIGLVLAIIGSIIGSSYAKGTLTNYTGFGMLLFGMATSILGACATVLAVVKNRLCKEMPIALKKNNPKTLFLSIWSAGIGLILTISGWILGNTFAKTTLVNTAGFGMLLTGICVFVLGISGTALGTLKIQFCEENHSSIKLEKPRTLFLSILSIGGGVVLSVVGSMLADSYMKENIMNYAGFGMLIIGITLLSLGISGTIVTGLKNRLNVNEDIKNEREPRVILGSIWAIGTGIMLLVNGSLIASSYAKTTTMNYAGFGLLLAGTGVFVYGVFETARIVAMGYLSGRRIHIPKRTRRFEPKETRIHRIKEKWNSLVRTSTILNLAGAMVALGLLFFSLWQLDLIVSGPVWWSSGSYGTGQGWSHLNGAYANDYFQCYLWKTTIGQAYDTLFMLIFISFIVLFASAFFWPRGVKESRITLKLKGREDFVKPKKKRINPRKKKRATESKKSETTITRAELAEEKTRETEKQSFT